jgi:hypothetical protein
MPCSSALFVAGASGRGGLRRPHRRGVHAVGQVIHFDTAAARTPRAWVLGRQHQAAAGHRPAMGGRGRRGFHARHTAIRRTYRYCILNRSARSALQRRARLDPPPLDAAPCMPPRRCCSASMISRRSARSSASRRPRSARRAHRGASRGRLSSGWRSAERLSAPHGAQHRRHAARRAARGDPAGARWRACSRPAIGGAGATAPPAGCTCGASITRRVRHSRPRTGFYCAGGLIWFKLRAMSWFERIVPSRIKTERRTRSVPEGLWTKCPGLRCGAVSRGNRAQSARLPEVQPPHAHQRPRAAAKFLDMDRPPSSRPRSNPRIRSSSRTRSATRTGSCRRRSRPVSATR